MDSLKNKLTLEEAQCLLNLDAGNKHYIQLKMTMLARWKKDGYIQKTAKEEFKDYYDSIKVCDSRFMDLHNLALKAIEEAENNNDPDYEVIEHLKE